MDNSELLATIESVRRTTGALDLLWDCTRWAPTDIPLDGLILEDVIFDGVNGVTLEEASEMVTADSRMPALDALVKSGLIEVHGMSLSIRPDVQSVARDYVINSLSELRRSSYVDQSLMRTVDLANRWFPDDVSDGRFWPFCERMLPHGISALESVRRRLVLEASSWWSAQPDDVKSLLLGNAADLSYRLTKYLESINRLKEARDIRLLIVAIREALVGPDNADLIVDLSNLSLSLRECGDYVGARETLQRAVDLSEAHGVENERKSNLYGKMGAILAQLNELQASANSYKHALQLCTLSQTVDNQHIGRLQRELGEVYLRLGEPILAHKSFKIAVDLGLKSLLPSDPVLGMRYALLGSSAKEIGDINGARIAYEEALKIGLAAFGPSNRDVRRRFDALIEMARNEKDAAGITATYGYMISADIKASGESSKPVAQRYAQLANVLKDVGDYNGSESAFARSIEIFEAIHLDDDEAFATLLNTFALFLHRLGKNAQAADILERVIAVDENRERGGLKAVAVHYANYGRVLIALGKLDEALLILERAKAMREASGDVSSQSYGNDLEAVGTLRLRRGERDIAHSLITAAYDIAVREFGPSHPRSLKLQKTLDSEGWN